MTSVERPDTTRQRAAEAMRRTREFVAGVSFGVPEDAVPSFAEALTDATARVVLDDIEAVLEQLPRRGDDDAGWVVVRLIDVIAAVHGFRERNGWSRD